MKLYLNKITEPVSDPATFRQSLVEVLTDLAFGKALAAALAMCRVEHIDSAGAVLSCTALFTQQDILLTELANCMKAAVLQVKDLVTKLRKSDNRKRKRLLKVKVVKNGDSVALIMIAAGNVKIPLVTARITNV